MASIDEHDEREWPPGTVRIELITRVSKDQEIILQPRPSDDPNDPLNWSEWRKHLNFGLVSFYAFMVFAFIGTRDLLITLHGAESVY